MSHLFFFFFNDTATTEISTLSLHDALPIALRPPGRGLTCAAAPRVAGLLVLVGAGDPAARRAPRRDRARPARLRLLRQARRPARGRLRTRRRRARDRRLRAGARARADRARRPRHRRDRRPAAGPSLPRARHAPRPVRSPVPRHRAPLARARSRTGDLVPDLPHAPVGARARRRQPRGDADLPAPLPHPLVGQERLGDRGGARPLGGRVLAARRAARRLRVLQGLRARADDPGRCAGRDAPRGGPDAGALGRGRRDPAGRLGRPAPRVFLQAHAQAHRRRRPLHDARGARPRRGRSPRLPPGRPVIREIPGHKPRVHPDAYVDPLAAVIGDVTIDAGASVWPFTVLRGDQDNYVRLGKNSNVQENSVLHVTPEYPCIVGDNVTIGHGAVVHACTVMNNCRIGIGAVVLNGAVVEEGAQVGAGALVPPGKVVRAGWLVMGVPAKPVRQMTPEELEDILRNAREYVDLWRRNLAERVVAATPTRTRTARRRAR